MGFIYRKTPISRGLSWGKPKLSVKDAGLPFFGNV